MGRAPGLGRTCGFAWPLPPTGTLVAGGAPTLQQAQYFQQSRSSSAGSNRRNTSRGMSHQKAPGGQSREEGEEVGTTSPTGVRQATHTPPAGAPAHPSSSAPGRCCWARGRHHPPRCSCMYSRHPRPGRSSTPPPPPLHPQTVGRAPNPTPEHLRAW